MSFCESVKKSVSASKEVYGLAWLVLFLQVCAKLCEINSQLNPPIGVVTTQVHSESPSPWARFAFSPACATGGPHRHGNFFDPRQQRMLCASVYDQWTFPGTSSSILDNRLGGVYRLRVSHAIVGLEEKCEPSCLPWCVSRSVESWHGRWEFTNARPSAFLLWMV